MSRLGLPGGRGIGIGGIWAVAVRVCCRYVLCEIYANAIMRTAAGMGMVRLDLILPLRIELQHVMIAL